MPSHWAVSGVARNVANARVNADRFIELLDRGWGGCGGCRGWWRSPRLGATSPTSTTSTTSTTCFSSVHPHRSDRHARERVIPQATGDARVEHLGQPEIDADPEPEHQIGWKVADDERQRGLDVRDDAHSGSLRIEPAPERQSEGDVELRATAHQVGARAEHDRAVERKIDGVRDDTLARLDAREQHRLAGAGRIEDAAAQSDVELAARIAIGALDAGAASVGKAEHGTDLGP